MLFDPVSDRLADSMYVYVYMCVCVYVCVCVCMCVAEVFKFITSFKSPPYFRVPNKLFAFKCCLPMKRQGNPWHTQMKDSCQSEYFFCLIYAKSKGSNLLPRCLPFQQCSKLVSSNVCRNSKHRIAVSVFLQGTICFFLQWHTLSTHPLLT